MSERASKSPDASATQRKLSRDEFAALYCASYSRLAIIAASIVRDRVLAEDIVQEAAIIGFDKIAAFTPGTSFAAWMAAIVRRCALNYARKTRSRATFASDPHRLDHEQKVSAASVTAASVTPTGELLVDQPTFDDDVVRALNGISEEARTCILLRVVLDLSYNEIAELLEIPKGTAMSHVHRGKAAMRDALKHRFAGSSEQSP